MNKTIQRIIDDSISRFKDEVEISSTESVSLKSSAQNGDILASLTFDSIRIEDGGEIKAMARNPAGEATSKSRLNVLSELNSFLSNSSFFMFLMFLGNRFISICSNVSVKKEKPRVTKPDDVEVSEDDDVLFESTVIAKPEATVEWSVILFYYNQVI